MNDDQSPDNLRKFPEIDDPDVVARKMESGN